MHVEDLREYCLSKKGANEEFPFDDVTLCFKVMNKIFAIVPLDDEQLKINLKCDPAYAIELRESHPEVQPGFHMNKKHWNTVFCDDGLKDKLLRSFVDHSYDMVVKGMRKVDRLALEEL